MSRDRKAPVRKGTPDAIYHSTVVEKFICRMMIDGKKSVSTRILYTAMNELGEKSGEKTAQTCARPPCCRGAARPIFIQLGG